MQVIEQKYKKLFPLGHNGLHLRNASLLLLLSLLLLFLLLLLLLLSFIFLVYTHTHSQKHNRKLLMQTSKISTSMNKSRKIGLHQIKKYHKGKTLNKLTQLRNSSSYNTTTKPSYSNSPWQCTDIFVIKRHFS